MAKEFWDSRYGTEGFAYGTAPNAFLARHCGLIPAGGRVLLPADGEGRNGVFLAKQGLDVLSFDFSCVAVAKAQKLAADNAVAIDARVAAFEGFDYPVEELDAVALIFVHQASPLREYIHEKCIAALKPGGLILLQAFRPEQLDYNSGGAREPERLYTEDILRADFASLEIALLESTVETLDEGEFHRGEAATISLIARK